MSSKKKPKKLKTKDQPNNTGTKDDALFIVKITKGPKLIEQLMSAEDLQDTGVGGLTAKQKAALNAFLDPSLVVAPGHTD